MADDMTVGDAVAVLAHYAEAWSKGDPNDRDARAIRVVLDALAASGKDAEAPIELAMCEAAHLCLRPAVLYRFTARPGCDECESLARVYAVTAPAAALARTQGEG